LFAHGLLFLGFYKCNDFQFSVEIKSWDYSMALSKNPTQIFRKLRIQF